MFEGRTYDAFHHEHRLTSGIRFRPPENQGEPPIEEHADFDTIVVVNTDRAFSAGMIFETKIVFESKERLAEFLATYVEHLDVEGRKLVRTACDIAGGVTPVTQDLVLPPGIERRST